MESFPLHLPPVHIISFFLVRLPFVTAIGGGGGGDIQFVPHISHAIHIICDCNCDCRWMVNISQR